MQGLARLVLLHKLQELGTPAETAAARFNIPKDVVCPYDCLLDFVQFMELEAITKKMQKSEAAWQARLYYTKRCSDTLKAEAVRKAAKEAERLRVLELEEEDRRRRYQVVDHVREQ